MKTPVVGPVAARVRHRIRSRFVRRNLGPRPASFPFISGDTYRSVCDFVIESREDLQLFLERSTGPAPVRRLFCSADLASDLLTQLGDDRAASLQVVVHNGDLIPTETLAAHARRFRRVHSVNWVGDPGLVDPLPIGLENAWWANNGRLALFEDSVPHRRAELLRRPRSHDVLLAFRDSTCPHVRSQARDAFASCSLRAARPDRLEPGPYQRLLRDSLFVVSPRGNGIDCHRTWEAIYAGAVPVVLREHWGFGHLGLPVLVAESWSDAVDQIEPNPRGLYDQIVRSGSHAVFALDLLEALVLRGDDPPRRGTQARR